MFIYFSPSSQFGTFNMKTPNNRVGLTLRYVLFKN